MSLGWLAALQITGRRRSARPVTQSSSGIERSPGFPSPHVRNGSKKAKCDRIGVRFCAVSDQIAEVTEHLKIANRRIDRRLFDKGALLHRRLVVTRPERLKSPPEAPIAAPAAIRSHHSGLGGEKRTSESRWPIACPSKHLSTRAVPVGSLAFGMTRIAMWYEPHVALLQWPQFRSFRRRAFSIDKGTADRRWRTRPKRLVSGTG